MDNHNLSLKTTHLPNPYGTSRVDNPFQKHLDLSTIHQKEYETLKSILLNIKQDPNHQSQGAVILGEAGNGKTHLAMRLAENLLKNNRLLFINQPNNPQTILYHIYTQVLNSFVKIIPETSYSQLEYLLAHSFSKIVTNILSNQKPTETVIKILKEISDNPLNLYKHMRKSEKKDTNWNKLSQAMLKAWDKKHGIAECPRQIVTAFIRFCQLPDSTDRDLIQRWLNMVELSEEEQKQIQLTNLPPEISKEQFALQVMSVFGKLSIEDEPLIFIFDQLEGLKYNEELLNQFGESLKELFTHVPNSLIITNLFRDRWHYFKNFFNDSVIDRMSQYILTLQKPDNEKLHTILTERAKETAQDIQQIFQPEDIQTILSQRSIRAVLKCAAEYYRYRIENIPLPTDIRSSEDEIYEKIRFLEDQYQLIQQQLQALINTQNPTKETLKDKNLLKYFLQTQQKIEQNYIKQIILQETDDIGKLRFIIETFKVTCYLRIMPELTLSTKKLPEHLHLKTPHKDYIIGFLHSDGNNFASRLKNFNELAIQQTDKYFILFRDERQSEITGKVSKDEIKNLKNLTNGAYLTLDKNQRLLFETIYTVIQDIQNRDYNCELTIALNTLQNEYHDYWLIAMINEKLFA